MSTVQWFIKLMKGELSCRECGTNRAAWVVDESKYLQVEEVSALRNEASKAKQLGKREGRFSLIRDWFMIELGLYAGLRVEEMARMVLRNLAIDNGRSTIFVRGKGDKIRPVLIGQGFRSILVKYLGLRQRFGFGDQPDSPVLPNLQGNHISKRQLQRAFKRLSHAAGLPKHLSIHSLRHTYCTFLLKASGNNYRLAQRQLGHASIRTTQTYAGVVEDEARRTLDKLYHLDAGQAT